jgi:hypothetical protein
MMRSNAVFAVLVLVSTPLAAQGRPLQVYVETAPHRIDAATFGRLTRDTIRMAFHGQPAISYEGVPLAIILQSVGVRTDSLRSGALSTRIVLEASDGYRVVLPLADLDPSLGNRRVIIADRADGKALPDDEAPFRLVIQGEARPARSARQITAIRVLAER